jgi:hypothetical protein
LGRQILGILGSHIEIEGISFIACVLINLQWCCLGVENLDKLVMIYKNWPVDVQVDYKLVGDKLGEFFWQRKCYWKKMKSCLKRQAILRRNNHVFGDVRWVAYAF